MQVGIIGAANNIGQAIGFQLARAGVSTRISNDRAPESLARYLGLLSKPPRSEDRTPVLKTLRGSARSVSADAYLPPAPQPEASVKRFLLDLDVVLDRQP